MIDVLHPSTSDVNHHSGSKTQPSRIEDDGDDEEAAWLQSVQAAGANDLTAVQGLQSGDLVMDISQLREEPTPAAAKRSSKSRFPS